MPWHRHTATGTTVSRPSPSKQPQGVEMSRAWSYLPVINQDLEKGVHEENAVGQDAAAVQENWLKDNRCRAGALNYLCGRTLTLLQWDATLTNWGVLDSPVNLHSHLQVSSPVQKTAALDIASQSEA